MTELRKGQQVWVAAFIGSSEPDRDGDIKVYTLLDGEGGAYEFLTAERNIQPLNARKSESDYLARREAMVRAVVEPGDTFTPLLAEMVVKDADALLRAIDETPVPEWAGGEHE